MLAVLAGLAGQAYSAETKGGNEAVVVVNGEAIPRSEFDRDWAAFAAEQEKVMTPDQMTAEWERSKKSLLLEQVIQQRLVLQEAKKKGVTASQKDIDAVVLKTRQRFQVDAQGRALSASEAEEAFQKELAKEGLTEKQFAKHVQNQLLAAVLTNQMMKEKVKPPTEEEVRKLFEDVKNRMGQPSPAAATVNDSQQPDLDGLARYFKAAVAERVRVQRVLFLVTDRATVAQRRAAARRAEEVKAKLDKGADFADLAELYSDDKRSAAAGGDIGYVLRGDVKDLDDTLFSIPVGGVSGVVETKQGYQIFRIPEKRAASNIRYRAARAFLIEYLVRLAKRVEYVRFVDELKKRAAIDIKIVKL
jgi:parvulin-like peptidyl-prolyl isomerase